MKYILFCCEICFNFNNIFTFLVSLGVKKSGKLQEIIHLNLQLKLAILDLDSDDIFTIGGFPPNKFFGQVNGSECIAVPDQTVLEWQCIFTQFFFDDCPKHE